MYIEKASRQKIAVHFIGIGGIGMSGLARYFKAQGYLVSGSDSANSVITESLKKEGVRVKAWHSGGIINRRMAFVVYNRAIKADNPELVAAKKLDVPTLPYATVLGRLTEQYATIAITGSHGKSTTTALAGLALMAAKLDPTILVGTNLRELGGKNIRIGKSPFLVLEADDYAAAFLAYSPIVSIITNIDREHMDFYKTLGGVKRAFLKFMERTQDGGALILNRDDENLWSLKSKVAAIAKKKKLRIVWYSIGEQNQRSAGAKQKRKLITNMRSGREVHSMVQALKRTMQIPGTHNLSNAMAVLELGRLLKIPEKKTIAALGSYHGAWRRMEYRGTLSHGIIRSAPVFDDYAHHPTEIKATLQAFREKYPKSPLVCVFQPHQAKRLQALFKEFTHSFADADVLVLLPSYTVAGRDEIATKFTSEYLAATITKAYPHKTVFYLDTPSHIKKVLNATPGIQKAASPVIIMMGAGDIVQYTDSLIK